MTKRRPKNNPKQPQPAQPVVNSDEAVTTTGHADDGTSPPHTLASTKAMLERLPSLSRILSVLMLLLGIFAVGALFYKVMAGFFVPLFLAALLVVIFRPVHDWIYVQTKGKRRLAAASTTLMILMMVLMPMIVVLSVATSQFTAMVSHMNFNDLTAALDRARDQFGISLPHAEKFRRLDESVLTGEGLRGINQDTSVAVFLQSLSGVMQAPENRQKILDNISEAKSLIRHLQENVAGPPTADTAAETAIDRLNELKKSLPQNVNAADLVVPVDSESAVNAEVSSDDAEGGSELDSDESESLDQLNAEEQFHRQSVIASAAIRSWMQILLGGTLRSQVRLIANPSAEDFKSLLSRGRESLQPRFVSLTSATGNYLGKILVGLLVLIIAVYFFLIDGAAMIRTLMRLSPLDDNYERRLLLEFDRTSRAVVLASVLSAVVQGILGGLGFYVLGFESVVLLFLATTLMSLVPFLGAASVWVPCVVWLGMVEQRWTAAIVLALYGVLVISSIDNVIKVYVLHGRSQLHPLFALLSVLGGVKVFGPIGILVGPMVVVFLQTLLEILNHELDDTAPAEAIAETEANVG